MSDLKNGILNINGFILSKDSRVSDFASLAAEDVEIKVSKQGNTYIRFLCPVQSNGIDVFVEVSFYTNSELPEIELYPSVPSSVQDHGYGEVPKYMVSAAKQWLRGVIDEAPTSEGDESILYSYDWGYICAATREDLHYGLIGGEMKMMFIGG